MSKQRRWQLLPQKHRATTRRNLPFSESHSSRLIRGVQQEWFTKFLMDYQEKEMKSSTYSRLSDLVNIGNFTAKLLIEVDVSTAQELRAIGPVAAWRRIQSKHPERATLACLYALQGALLGVPGKALPEAIIEELLNQIQSDW
jgi:hypothetical protein